MSEAAQEAQEAEEGQLLREHLFDGELLQLPIPDEGIPGFLPEWFDAPLPALVYPPLEERVTDGEEQINLEITPYSIFYGALRELAETADEGRSDMLRRAVLAWNENAALEVCHLARERIEQDVESALLHYELAMELDEGLFEAIQDGGMCEYALSAVAGEERGDRLASAEELFRRAIEIRPESGLSWWSLARALNDLGEPEEAQELLVRFLNEQPEGTERELVEEALRDGLPSAQSFGEAAPEVSEEQAVFGQAQALAFGEDPAKAIELLEPLAEVHPDSGEVWFVLGAAHRRLEQTDEAERCLRRAARLAPHEPFVWWELAQAYADEGQWSAVENSIRRGLELEPENPGFLLLLGRALTRQGDYDGAAEALEQAREQVPDDEEVRAALEELEAGGHGRR